MVQAASTFRPSSYAVTLIRESEPGEIHDPNLRLYPPYPLFSGLSRLEVSVRWMGGQWHATHRWLIAPPANASSLARLTTAPVPGTSASDGHRIWSTDPEARTVTVYPPSPAGTWPATEGDLKRFAREETLAALLQSNFHCVTPIRRGDSEIAGRPAYVLEFGPDRCRRPKGGRHANQSRLRDGRLVVWIDQQTHFMLRAEQYAFDHPDHLLLSWQVTSIEYDIDLDPALFRLSVPPGYTLLYGR